MFLKSLTILYSVPENSNGGWAGQAPVLRCCVTTDSSAETQRESFDSKLKAVAQRINAPEPGFASYDVRALYDVERESK